MAISLRPYQSDACVRVMNEWQTHDRVLISLPTGTGKGRMLAWLADAWRDTCEMYERGPRVLWLTHRVELLVKAKDDLEEATGEVVGVEQGELRCDSEMFSPRIIAASIDSLKRAARRESFNPNQFGLVLYDEVHHSVAEKNLEVLTYFGSSKVCGATATTDRADEISLGTAFTSCAFHMDIRQAIADGWLCPVLLKQIQVDVDFSKVQEDDEISLDYLDRVLTEEGPLHQVAAGVVKAAGDRQTVVFVPRVASAKAIANLIADRYTKRGAGWVSGNQNPEERAAIVSAYQRGDIQFIVNVDCLTEGWDAPRTSCIVIARPTKSRAKFTQMIGRGLRGGVNCPIEGKRDCLVLEMAGNAGKLSLISSVDVLGGCYDRLVVEAARKACVTPNESETPADVMQALAEAARNADDLRRLDRLRIIGEAKIRSKNIDPFIILDLGKQEMPGWWVEKPPSESQLKFLEENGVITTGLAFSDCKQLCDDVIQRREQGLCTPRQARLLMAWGYDSRMPFEQARKILDGIFSRPKDQVRTSEDAKRYAIRRANLKRATMVSCTREATIIRKANGEFAGLEYGPQGAREVVKDVTRARKLYRELQAAGAKIVDSNPTQPQGATDASGS